MHGEQRGPSDSSRIARARWQLWATTFVILASLALFVVFLSGEGPSRTDFPLPPRQTLRLSLIGLIVGFVLYAVDRERHLRMLGDRLTRERIEKARLETRVESLTELQRERDTNAALLDGSADGIAVVDTNLRLLRFNDAMAALCEITPETALESYAPAVLRFASPAGDPLEAEGHPLAVAVRNGEPATLELKLRLSEGDERWVSGTFSPIRDGKEGPIALVLVTARDITEQKEMESMQRDFVSIVSHELRSPLTAIKGFAKTLLQRDGELDASSRRDFLTTVNEQSDRLSRLVEDLLQVSRIDARRLRFERQDFDLAAMVGHLTAQFAIKWGNRSIAVDAGAGGIVHADPRKVEEILINLIDNAVKYSLGEAPVTVRIRRAGDLVEVGVEDNGFGIAPEDAANLFQKFQRISTPATRDIGGTGLGLYIVKGLVEAHGGSVWVESVPGNGSTFGFTLPASAAVSNLLAGDEPDLQSAATGEVGA
ncbi:MAG: ATP-binding protein [Actinomycetota bacterium]|nr:PAS domain-containing protein [Actinomycetota bacterium]